MSWTTSTSDLRVLLSDGPKDKYRYRKRVFGLVDGTNKTFQTFEFRRISNLVGAAAPLGVYVNGSAVTVSADSPEAGEFTLQAAPADGVLVEATYYIQWFLDTELDQFLKSATQWLGLGDDCTKIADGLRPSALKYAAHDAYQKLALRFAEHMSERFRLEDGLDPKLKPVIDSYQAASEQFMKEAVALRNDYYTRQGQSLSPLYGFALGNVSDPMPKR